MSRRKTVSLYGSNKGCPGNVYDKEGECCTDWSRRFVDTSRKSESNPSGRVSPERVTE